MVQIGSSVRRGFNRTAGVRAVLLMGAVLCGGAGPAAGAGDDTTRDRVEPDLANVLGRLHGVAQLYLDEALHFTCDETVIYLSRRETRSDRFDYIYVYDPDRGLIDRRVSKQDDTEEIRHGGLVRPYSWIFVFESNKREMYRYALAGRDRVLGREALKVRFTPAPPYVPGKNDFEGIAWVDRQTFQLLRVEAEKVRAVRRALNEEYVEKFTTEFDVEKNGMRFPSRVVIRRSNFGQRGRPGTADYQASAVYRVTQTYSDYRFFGVRTREEIQSRTGDAVDN